MIRLNQKQILMMHSQLIKETGGTDGIRDKNLLSSALETPFQTFAGEELFPSIQAKAARLCYGLVKNHAMLDGNKRIGVHAMLVFLALNGYELVYTQAELIDIILSLADGKVEYEVPEGTQTGTVFRLKGKGIPKLKSNVRGDQYVKVTVEIPKKLNEKQKELVREFAKECGQEVHQRQKTLSDKIDNFFKNLKKK